MVGFVAGVMYLVQAARLKRKLPPSGRLRLPSLEWLEKINSRVVILSALLILIGFLSGIVLKVTTVGREAMAWNDPVVSSSALMLLWLLAAALFNAVYRPARHGRKVAYLTVASFGFLVIVLGTFLLVDTGHGRAKPDATLPAEPNGGQP
jgi:hypothetical protein